MNSLLKKLLQENYVHVIDDFYPDLSWLEEYKKNAIFKPIHAVNYAGLTAPPPAGIEKTMERIMDMLGGEIEFSHYDGQIRFTQKADEGTEKIKIHNDLNRIIILIYLSEAPAHLDPVDCGTFFYHHKKMKRKRFILTNALANEFQDTILNRDTHDTDKWDNWLTIPFKKNRALIYDGNLYHAPTKLFYGDDVFTGRVTQHFFPLNRFKGL
jgi:hypothetical protein